MVTAIGSLVDGRPASVRGTVRAAGPLLTTDADSGVEYVYRDQRRGLEGEPTEREAVPFWVEDASAKVLVHPEHLVVDTRAERRELVIEAANADIQAVSARIKVLKDQLRAGSADPLVHEERRRLAKVATLLCAVKAHARGKVHLSGTLASQAEWIQKNQGLLVDGEGRALELLAERFEVVLAPGMEVEVHATFRVGPMPAGMGHSGYRDRPTCMMASGAADDPVRVVGIGAAAPRPPDPPKDEEVEAAVESFRQRRPLTRDQWAGIAVLIATAIAWFLMD